MALTLADLMAPRDVSAWTAQLLAALQGLGYVKQTGTGSGRLSLTGVATVTRTLTVEISTGGELGTAAFRWSLAQEDGTTTTGGPITVPGGGSYVLPGTGVTLVFSGGP